MIKSRKEISVEIAKLKQMTEQKLSANTFISSHAAVNALEWVLCHEGAIVPSMLTEFLKHTEKQAKQKMKS